MPDIFNVDVLQENIVVRNNFISFIQEVLVNGIIVDYNSQYINYIKEKISILKPDLRDKVLRLILELDTRKRLFSLPITQEKPSSEEKWVSLILDIEKIRKIYGLVSSLPEKYASLIKNIIDIKCLPESELWMGRRRTLAVQQDENGFRKSITPLLRYARKIQLIDPYFTCHEERYKESMRIIVDIIESSPLTTTRYIQIHTGDPNRPGDDRNRQNINDRKRSWEDFMTSICKKKNNYGIYFWGLKERGVRFHDRYIITDQCGVGVQAGLDIRKSETTWSLLDKEVVDILIKDTDYRYSSFQQLNVGRTELKL
jgi:hypothetical protein